MAIGINIRPVKKKIAVKTSNNALKYDFGLTNIFLIFVLVKNIIMNEIKNVVNIPLIKIIFNVEKSFSVNFTEYFTIVSFAAKHSWPNNINDKPLRLLSILENIFILKKSNLDINNIDIN